MDHSHPTKGMNNCKIPIITWFMLFEATPTIIVPIYKKPTSITRSLYHYLKMSNISLLRILVCQQLPPSTSCLWSNSAFTYPKQEEIKNSTYECKHLVHSRYVGRAEIIQNYKKEWVSTPYPSYPPPNQTYETWLCTLSTIITIKHSLLRLTL